MKKNAPPERRYLKPVEGFRETPNFVNPVQAARPKNPADRGNIDFVCPGCQAVLITEMDAAYVPKADPIWCLKCERWYSPSGLPART